MYKEKGTFILLTGLSGSGKSTLAKQTKNYYTNRGYSIVWLDGDEMRKNICNDLGFSKEDRNKNIYRIGQVGKILVDAGVNVVCSVIAPYRQHRLYFRKLFKPNYFQFYLNPGLEICKQRDVKGLYNKVEEGKINNMTGIGDNYETPKNNNVVIDTNKFTIGESMYIITNETTLTI